MRIFAHSSSWQSWKNAVSVVVGGVTARSGAVFWSEEHPLSVFEMNLEVLNVCMSVVYWKSQNAPRGFIRADIPSNQFDGS